MKSNISLIIPTYNEAGNILSLVRRIHNALHSLHIIYEIIFIDDHSVDKTQEEITSLAATYPIKLFLKKGKKGKAQSLIEGFSYAKYDFICMIDGDLQYPPEAIPAMFKKIENGADIVVANRKEQETHLIRRVTSTVYSYIFNKLLHGINVDAQSGLKIFRREIIERIPLKAGTWTLDLELLIKAKDAGYKVVGHDIILARRYKGKTKINFLPAAWEIGISALRLKLTRSEIIPFHRDRSHNEGQGFHYKGKEFIHHSDLHPRETAYHRLSGAHIVILSLLVILFIFLFIINWHLTVTVFVGVLTFIYFADLLFNLFLVIRSFSKPLEIRISEEEIRKLPDERWPSYTIFCPLYKEWQVVPQFITSMSRLDYPKDKLQVMLLLEQDDKETIEQIKKYDLPAYFDIVIVPPSLPKTKPKACNYGLKHATGEYTVIYDAEDVPDPLQLKKAVLAFEKADPHTICIQAKLNFYNPHQNILTRVFTAEYSLWFDLVLTGLQSIQAPIPLGGTSNHFRTKDLYALRGWDSFNVTEDADLGMRLVKRGYTTAIIDSLTLEEANSSLLNWFGQRSRWIKGYMQTYLVHIRNMSQFFNGRKKSHFITFQLIIGGKILSMFINPLMWTITISYFVFRAQIGPFIESFFPMPVLYMGVFSLVLGNFLYFYYYMIGCTKHGHDELVKYIFLVPFYWLAMSVAAWIAFYQLLVNPHHWSKTKHGLHLDKNKAIAQVTQKIGKDLVDQKLTRDILELSPAQLTQTT